MSGNEFVNPSDEVAREIAATVSLADSRRTGLDFPKPLPAIGPDWRCKCGAGPWHDDDRGVPWGNVYGSLNPDYSVTYSCHECAGVTCRACAPAESAPAD